MAIQLLPHHSIRDKQVQYYYEAALLFRVARLQEAGLVLCSYLVSFSEIFGACTFDAERYWCAGVLLVLSEMHLMEMSVLLPLLIGAGGGDGGSRCR